ncbi:MAG TPA: hypothetical protein VGR05_08100 [Sphingomicrobium sp.]|nr:hypothetical protein [Sphingomicrobium sp.]
MYNRTLLNRSGLAAIAAATALLSTPVLAQETAPVAADPAPIVADTPLPADPAPAPTPPAEAASDPLAPVEATTTTTTRTTRTTRPTRATAAPAARAPAPAARVETAAPVAPIAPTPEATPVFDPAMVAPLPETAAATPAPATGDSMIDNDLLPIAGAAGLGILALAGASLALRRRRREDDVVIDETYHEPTLARAAPMPVATAPIAAAPLAASVDKSAFNWGNTEREPASSKSWIDAARRGPTPDNPSLSLKKRLRRASFFEQRERAVAAGTAVPVSPMAGLPDHQSAPVPSAQPVRRVDQGVRMSFGRQFQPA